MTRIAIFEDDTRYRETLAELLRHTPDLQVVDTFPLLRPGLDAPAPWDLVLMDLELPDGSGIDGIRTIKARPSPPAIVVLTVFEEPATVLQAICAGADGYLLKRTPAGPLLAGLRSVLAGGSPLTPEIARVLVDLTRAGRAPPLRPPTRLDLTPREQDVLRSFAEGCSYKTAADRLDISVDTVRAHVRGLYRKLQVHNVAEAVSRAVREGLV